MFILNFSAGRSSNLNFFPWYNCYLKLSSRAKEIKLRLVYRMIYHKFQKEIP